MKITSTSPVAVAYAPPVSPARRATDAGAATRATSVGTAASGTTAAGTAAPATGGLPWEKLDIAVDIRVRLRAGGPDGDGDGDDLGRVDDDHDGRHHRAHGVRGQVRSGLAHLRNELRIALRDVVGDGADRDAVHDAVGQFGDDLRTAFQAFRSAEGGAERKQALIDDVRTAFETLLTKLGDAIEADGGGGAGVAPAAVEDSRFAALREIFEKLVAGLEQRLHIAESTSEAEGPAAATSFAFEAHVRARDEFSRKV